MKDIVVNISTGKGDEYHLRLSSAGGKYLSQEVYRMIEGNIEILAVELERVRGNMPTGHIVLSQIEKVIADTFMKYPNMIICYFCDFLSPIPATRKKIPAQQYRSILFTRMFERYVSQNPIGDIMQSVLTIGGIGEDFYIHLIARSEHIKYVNMISEDIRTGYSK